jgi:ATP-dependent RNA helicase SUPV3L1/SUV3
MIMNQMMVNKIYLERSVIYGITQNHWKIGVTEFPIFFFEKLAQDSTKFRTAFEKAKLSNVEEELMYKIFVKFMTSKIEKEDEDVMEVFDATDFTEPQNWYPEARKMNRRIIFHTGPTNSGKSWEAIQRLKESRSGVYCAPLRLLATEVWNKLNKQGLPCNLAIGDLKDEIPGADHTSCTIEMLNISNRVDVVIIDEIQMICDPNRGHAWTRALLGVQAEEIHLCGEERAISLIRDMIATTGDTLEIQQYQRLTPLTVMKHPLKALSDLERGDCVVTFSRKEVFHLKSRIEKQTNLKVAVVYGSLPPETRLLQAELFNDEESDYDVLVSTDAIGYGLNLNISRIVFFKTEKFDGTSMRPLTISETKQISGRAGRFKSLYPEGFVTAFSREDLTFIRTNLHKKVQDIPQAGLIPNFVQLEMFQFQNKKMNFSRLMKKMIEKARLSSLYFLCDIQEKYEVACLIEDVEMTLKEKYLFTLCPIDCDDISALRELRRYAEYHSMGKEVDVRIDLIENPKTPQQLAQIEACYQLLTSYCWLSFQFETTFVNREQALKMRILCENIIQRAIFEGHIREPTKHKKKVSHSQRLSRDLSRYGLDI